ncbi:MAG: pteridine reductase [Gammaproteobacteria bacterium]|nr:pteridine reductase [Gammaproteobacteria bacterium]MAY02860.1 pteridine reductase [Gammaproteobacteria bacterium]|tara:strand:+ start:463 stop:1224 length:762 start_codon:yes stop_codon:yes gene_type:complete
MTPEPGQRRVALISGSAARIGAGIARHLHGKGFNIVVHYQQSRSKAESLTAELNQLVPDSCICLQADLLKDSEINNLATKAAAQWSRIDVLINNASSFYPTPLADFSAADWIDLTGTNARAPAFLSQALLDELKKTQGTIINITDIVAESGREQYAIYAMAKAALRNLTLSLARELAPTIRVNAIAPGFILPPNFSASDQSSQTELPDPLSFSCLNYHASVEDIAHAVYFLIDEATYITGQSINIDGGRKLKF